MMGGFWECGHGGPPGCSPNGNGLSFPMRRKRRWAMASSAGLQRDSWWTEEQTDEDSRD
jgi:hypothetical protein